LGTTGRQFDPADTTPLRWIKLFPHLLRKDADNTSLVPHSADVL